MERPFADLLGLTEQAFQPFERFLVAHGAGQYIPNHCGDGGGSVFTILLVELREFLQAHQDGYFITSRSGDEVLDLVHE
jgi:hypothetical protein